MRNLLVLLPLFAAACDSADSTQAPVNAATAKAVPAAVREVRCGCKIEGIGHCGNYVSVDGKWHEITNPEAHKLGTMEWCSATAKVEADVAGELDGKGIRVSSLTVK